MTLSAAKNTLSQKEALFTNRAINETLFSCRVLIELPSAEG